MSSPKAALQATAIQQQCKLLRLPAVGAQGADLAELAVKEKQNHLDYLEALLAAEIEERERNTVARRLRDAHLPRMKTLEEFDFSQSPKISAVEIRQMPELTVEIEVVFSRQPLIEAVVFHKGARLLTNPICFAPNVTPQHASRARRRLEQPQQQANRRRLP